MMKVAVFNSPLDIRIPSGPEDGETWLLGGLDKSFIMQKLTDKYGQLCLVSSHQKNMVIMNLENHKLLPLIHSQNGRFMRFQRFGIVGNLLYGIEKGSTNLVMITNNFHIVRKVESPFGFLEKLQSYFALGFQSTREKKASQLSKWKNAWDPVGMKITNAFEKTFPIFFGDQTGFNWLYLDICDDVIQFGQANCEGMEDFDFVADMKETNISAKWSTISCCSDCIYKWLEDIPFETRISPPVVQIRVYDTRNSRNDYNNGVGVATILISVGTTQTVEVYYGTIFHSESQSNILWTAISFQISEKYDTLRNQNIQSYTAKLSANGEMLAIAITTNNNAYFKIHSLSTTAVHDKVAEVPTVRTLCPHLAVTDRKECFCAIADLQWLSEDCYIACITDCGYVSCFHKNQTQFSLDFQKDSLQEKNTQLIQFHSAFDSDEPVDFKKTYSLCWDSRSGTLVCCSGYKIKLLELEKVETIRTEDKYIKVEEDIVNEREKVVMSEKESFEQVDICASNKDEENNLKEESVIQQDGNMNQGEDISGCGILEDSIKVKVLPEK